MKLLEYQAKEVLSSLGIAIPAGKVARTPDEAAAACAQLGPVAVKAQVPVGGRGKAGGIKLAATPEEARKAAEQIIGMDIKGFKVPLVYCETALEIGREIYLGFTVDRDARANILMLSAKGGMEIEQVAEESPESIARLYPNPWRGPLDFQLTQLVFDAGLHAGPRRMGDRRVPFACPRDHVATLDARRGADGGQRSGDQRHFSGAQQLLLHSGRHLAGHPRVLSEEHDGPCR